MWGPLGILPGFHRSRAARNVPPEYVLLLGGDTHREQLAAEIVGGVFAANKKDGQADSPRSRWAEQWARLPVWVSSAHGDIGEVMAACGVKAPRVTIDHTATDTVTNFTTTAPYFRSKKVKHVAVFTSDYHASRADAVASLVFGGSGIAHTMIILPSPHSPATERFAKQETHFRRARDVMRSVLWLLCGIHLGEFGRAVHPERFH